MAMNFSTVLTTHGSSVEQWSKEVMKTYLGQVFWSSFMPGGGGDDNIIQVRQELNGKPGDAITTQIRSEVMGGLLRGAGQMAGNEGEIDFYPFRQTIDFIRQAVVRKNITMTDQRIAFNLLGEIRPSLEEKMKFLMEDDITAAMTDTTTGRVQGRYRYGALESNYDAVEATAKATIDNTADKLTTALITRMKLKARNPINAHAKIRPWKVKNMSMSGSQEWYVLVAHDYSVLNLIEDDPAWNNAMLNIPPTTHADSPIFKGQSFKGNWRGTLVYEWDRIPLESSTIQIAHNLYLGAQAGIVAWGQTSRFKTEESDYGETVGFQLSEVRGINKVVYDRAGVDSAITNEDNGVIHLYTAAVAP